MLLPKNYNDVFECVKVMHKIAYCLSLFRDTV